MVIILIVIKSYPLVRVPGFKAPLSSLLFEDGLAFYCIILISQIITLISWIRPSLVTYPVIESFPSFFVIIIACNRLLLRSQRLLQHGSDLSTSFTSRGLAIAAGITLEFRHGGNTNPTDYSIGEDLELARIRKEEKSQTQANTPRIESGSLPNQSLETRQEERRKSTLPSFEWEA
jgi:hypothetical protein